jgi:hypothetical protein
MSSRGDELASARRPRCATRASVRPARVSVAGCCEYCAAMCLTTVTAICYGSRTTPSSSADTAPIRCAHSHQMLLSLREPGTAPARGPGRDGPAPIGLGVDELRQVEHDSFDRTPSVSDAGTTNPASGANRLAAESTPARFRRPCDLRGNGRVLMERVDTPTSPEFADP